MKQLRPLRFTGRRVAIGKNPMFVARLHLRPDCSSCLFAASQFVSGATHISGKKGAISRLIRSVDGGFRPRDEPLQMVKELRVRVVAVNLFRSRDGLSPSWLRLFHEEKNHQT